MRPRERTQVRASGHQNAVDVMGSKIAPTAIAAIPTSLRMRSANGV